MPFFKMETKSRKTVEVHWRHVTSDVVSPVDGRRRRWWLERDVVSGSDNARSSVSFRPFDWYFGQLGYTHTHTPGPDGTCQTWAGSICFQVGAFDWCKYNVPLLTPLQAAAATDNCIVRQESSLKKRSKVMINWLTKGLIVCKQTSEKCRNRLWRKKRENCS